MRKSKKIISVILSVCILVGVLTFSASAEQSNSYSGSEIETVKLEGSVVSETDKKGEMTLGEDGKYRITKKVPYNNGNYYSCSVLVNNSQTIDDNGSDFLFSMEKNGSVTFVFDPSLMKLSVESDSVKRNAIDNIRVEGYSLYGHTGFLNNVSGTDNSDINCMTETSDNVFTYSNKGVLGKGFFKLMFCALGSDGENYYYGKGFEKFGEEFTLGRGNSYLCFELSDYQYNDIEITLDARELDPVFMTGVKATVSVSEGERSEDNDITSATLVGSSILCGGESWEEYPENNMTLDEDGKYRITKHVNAANSCYFGIKLNGKDILRYNDRSFGFQTQGEGDCTIVLDPETLLCSVEGETVVKHSFRPIQAVLSSIHRSNVVPMDKFSEGVYSVAIKDVEKSDALWSLQIQETGKVTGTIDQFWAISFS